MQHQVQLLLQVPPRALPFLAVAQHYVQRQEHVSEFGGLRVLRRALQPLRKACHPKPMHQQAGELIPSKFEHQEDRQVEPGPA